MVEMLMTWASGESGQSIRQLQPGMRPSLIGKLSPKEKLRQIWISQKDLQKIIARLEEL
jgi:hypothetical protein